MFPELVRFPNPSAERPIPPSIATGEIYPNAVADHERTLLRLNHNVFAEAQDIRRQLSAGLPAQRAGEYPYFQAASLLKEFAGSMGNSVSYVIENGRLYAPGNAISTSESLDKFASTGKGGPRATADAKSFAQIEQYLMTADGASVAQISPPSVRPDGSFEPGFGAYGFLNIFTRQGDQVTARHIMYQEDGGLTRSQAMREALGSKAAHTLKAEDYLIDTAPLMGRAPLEALMQNIGLSTEWRKFQSDQAFYNSHIAHDPYVRKWIDEYVGLQTKSAQETHEVLMRHGAQRAEEKLILAYKRATSLFDAKESIQKDQYSIRPIYSPGQMAHLQREFMMMPMRMSAGSCPIDYAAQSILGNRGHMGYFEISQAMSLPLSRSNEWKKMTDCVCCPGCKSVSNEKQPHLYNGKEWICGNSGCKAHKADIYNLVVRT
jgi:hypothetical protein